MAMLSFLTRDSKEVNESHMRNLILMAKSDNSIDESEIAVILKVGTERGFTEEEVKDMMRNSKSPDIIQPESEKDMFDQLYDLTLVMLADGIIEEDEMEFVTGFANEIGFRKTSSAFIVDSILEGMEKKMTQNQIYRQTQVFMKNIIE